jgi:hypothetical protein
VPSSIRASRKILGIIEIITREVLGILLSTQVNVTAPQP